MSFFFSFFLVRKIPFTEIELTSQRVRRYEVTSELPGRPVSTRFDFTLRDIYVAAQGVRYSIQRSRAMLVLLI